MAPSTKPLLRYAGAVEQHSEHPIASGILRKLKDDGLWIRQATDFKADPGHGVQGTVEGHKVVIASPKQAEALGSTIPERNFTDPTETVVFVVVDNRLAGAIALADPIGYFLSKLWNASARWALKPTWPQVTMSTSHFS